MPVDGSTELTEKWAEVAVTVEEGAGHMGPHMGMGSHMDIPCTLYPNLVPVEPILDRAFQEKFFLLWLMELKLR